MRRSWVIILVLFLSILLGIKTLFAQPNSYGNEWINYNQQYFKISTAEDGIYRLDYDYLSGAEFPVASVDPRRIQIFHRGKEQAILILDEDGNPGDIDGVFNQEDYIVFYGQRNDGTLDKELYITPEAQPHSYYNIYSDTTAYFLTWKPIGNGKRMVMDRDKGNINNLPAEPYHIGEKFLLKHSLYLPGLSYSLAAILSDFDYGEGWAGPRIKNGNYADHPFTGFNKRVESGPPPVLEVLLVGGNNNQHLIQVNVGPVAGSLRTLDKQASFIGYSSYKFIDTLQWSDIGTDGSLNVRITPLGVNGATDQVAVGYIKIRYAEAWDQDVFDEKVFRVSANPAGESFIRIINIPLTNNFAIYDLTNPDTPIFKEYNTGVGNINTVIYNTQQERKLLVTRRVIPNPTIKKVKFRNIAPALHNYLIITHPFLRRPGGGYEDPPKAYGAYRASAAGGNFDTLVVNISQLYDQFSYGEITPLSLYNFTQFMYNEGNPRYMMILGKGLVPEYNFHRGDFASQTYKDLIPPAGTPGTDHLFSAGLDGNDYVPAIPTGRISANDPSTISAYLNKVKEEEGLEWDALWRKNIVHLSGGKDENEQDRFFTYLNSYKRISEGPLMGASVVTERKLTNNETESIPIVNLVNEGVKLITFFGHSGLSGSDIDIGKVSTGSFGYNNPAKYPCILVNGCNAGDTYLKSADSFGEDWINTPELGAVGFVAHTNLGSPTYLNRYTRLFYEVAFGDSIFYGAGIGEIQSEVVRRYEALYGLSGGFNKTQVSQMALQGDPALAIFDPSNPDYEIISENIEEHSRDGAPISVQTEVFDLQLIVRNFGLATGDSIQITVSRKLSTGDVIRLDTLMFGPVYYLDTLYFPIYNIGAQAFGLNEFTVTIDPLNVLEEIDKTNNTAIFTYFVLQGGTANVFPYNFSVVSDTALTLIAHSLDLLMGERSFDFELDTTRQFSNPIKMASINSAVIAKWKINLFDDNITEKDSLVFYWRTKFSNPEDNEVQDWVVSSFTFIKDSPPGWSMSHFPQFENVSGTFVRDNQLQRKWEFTKDTTSIYVRTYGPDSPLGHEFVDLVIKSKSIYLAERCRLDAINMVAFTKNSASPYKVMRLYGGADIEDPSICGTTPQQISNFTQNEIVGSRRAVEQFIDLVKDEEHILIFTTGELDYSAWPSSTLDKLEEIGIPISTITQLDTGTPLIAFSKKGDPSFETEIILPDGPDSLFRESELDFYYDLTWTHTSGTLTSPKIGPAKQWGTFSQHTTRSEGSISDSFYYTVIGITPDNEEIEIDQVTPPTKELDLSLYSPLEYLYLRLQMHTENASELLPSQLKRWTVTYDPLPEGVLSLGKDQEAGPFEKDEGDTLFTKLKFENVSNLSFEDSIQVNFSLFNQDQRKTFPDSVKIGPLAAGESEEFGLFFESLGKAGSNNLRVFANPYILPEHDYNNNAFEIKDHLKVQADETNPVLEVTVDGEFIMDGDIVSPTPMIALRLKDENKFLLKDDTTGVELYLKRPCESCEFERISFSWPNVVWQAATEGSDFVVEYQPEKLDDGIYTIQAQAVDASGNLSGTEPYSIRFEVVNESQITNFYPYPNPFSSSTRFVFTLTGAEIPDEIIIQIMTISGTIVREITQDEIGPIKIGNNITQYAWDGRDEFGDQLANGVYLYRVKVQLNGESMEMRATAADRAFKNGFGKLYLLR